MAAGRDTQELVRQFRSAGGPAGWQQGKGGMPSCRCYLYVVGDVPAGPSWSKHFQALSWVGGPLSPKHLVSPVPGVAAPCNYACLPVQGATWARVPRSPGAQEPRQGRSVPRRRQLGSCVSKSRRQRRSRETAAFEPQCLHCAGADVRVDRTARTSCNANKQTYLGTQHASNPPATANHCQPLR